LDLKSQSPATQNFAGNLPAHGAGEVPEGLSDIILRRGENEEILWRGRPQFSGLAITAFHTKWIALYFAGLAGFSGWSYGLGSGLTLAVMGLGLLAILYVLAYLYSKNSHYVLTNERLLILTGLAVEKRVSIPLSSVGAAHLKMRSGDVGTIALQISGERQLGYLVLWPHVRPFRFNRTQPLIRVVENAPEVARLLTEAVAGRAKAKDNVMEINLDTVLSNDGKLNEAAPA